MRIKTVFLFILLGISVHTPQVLAEDLSPPEIIEFSISPTTIDVSQSSKVVTVTMRITDNESGVETPNVTAGSDNNSASTGFGQVNLVSGTDVDGIWEARLTVPMGTTAGDWSVSVFPLRDKADNTGTFGPPSRFERKFTVISEAQDLAPPEMIDFSISPTTVDVSQASQVVTVAMHITDNESGVVTPNVTAGSDNNSASTGFGDVRLVSGSDLDGVWEARLTIPKGSTSGGWSVSVFPLSDKADNTGEFGPPSRFERSFTVISEAEDLTPPQLVDFSISPTTIDVSQSSEIVIVTMHITDNESGVETPNVTAGSDRNSASTGFGQVNLISGTDLDGIWEARLTIPKGTTSGNWSVSVFPLRDKADNTGEFGPPSHFNDSFVVINDIAYTKGDADNDGKADVLWRNVDDGRNWMWTMDGLGSKQSAGINVITNQAWKIVGRGDFDGDGKSDILWRNEVTGRNYIYLMDGFIIKKQGELNYVYDSQWKIKEVLDLNGDGLSDIIWRHEGRGDTWIYLMDGLKAVVSQSSLNVADLDWEIVASGDVNNDGYDDVIWRHRTRGTNYIWLMEGVNISTRYSLNTVNTNWSIVGAGDINGDGTDDIIWRNYYDGRNWAYLMQNGQIHTSAMINIVANTDWAIADVADFDGDGNADIFWRQLSTGQSYVYLLDSLKINKQGYGATVSTHWHVIN
ncbi:VCBS repeat-containing protein [Alteromonas stellipolaris]|uniref:FG-GAP repeat domain-containing protein n=1 Tax=Alteromonas stellipolaris TaxID=233316 RepID=UPI0021198333|nr:VCBS repeat-containing protein [Alteromonas stellipolaris]MCQ8850422.1 VCBS repeat-containing protein [Alteromonas stellipolaris]